ncbi:membrane protein DedA, SNARE-associated domain [Amycolatopsis arida]|uniref:Membrane protein DedA, SNARE-associated domain n=1 Tax=Amycolatopsis arida TaxID=587909 RepID=A0A1I5KT19_9PSEU|nr:DedA family protein [Amycolatopsis arida]TDX97162.1 membrane protein DedA with SNARE-associated domain [Amycolatopsis arida]SFO87541.1 membrane protein DedA, SNARE-associated domain [Amycolatopsis arida]
MALVTDVLEWLQSLPPAGVTAAAGLLVLGECTLGLGFIAPGETGLFILGTTATSAPKFLIMWLVTTVCAVTGDSIGFFLGRKFGPRLRQTKMVQKHGADGWNKASAFLVRRGSWAVLVAIYLPVMRTLVPAAAGASGLAFRRFLPPVIVGATGWCALHIGIGAAAGEAAKQIEDAVGKGSWILLIVIALAVATVTVVKRRRRAASARAAETADTERPVEEAAH